MTHSFSQCWSAWSIWFLPCLHLWLVDVSGRKKLILAGTLLQSVSFALVGWFYHVHGSGLAVLIFVMTFVAGHAFGNGVACWVIISEIYPTKVEDEPCRLPQPLCG